MFFYVSLQHTLAGNDLASAERMFIFLNLKLLWKLSVKKI